MGIPLETAPPDARVRTLSDADREIAALTAELDATRAERDAAEHRLQLTLEELERAIELAPVGIVVARDPECRHAVSNPYMARMLGVPVGVNVSASAPTDARLPYQVRQNGRLLAPEEMPVQRAAASGQPVLDQMLEITRSDGTWVDVLISAAPLVDDDGRPRGAVGTLLDVTAWNAIHRQLRDSEERVRLAVEHVGIGTWDMDLVTGRVIWSPTHFEALGYAPRPDGEGSYDLWRSRVHPEDAGAVLEAWQSAQRRPDGAYCTEYRIARADTGETRWLSARGRMLFDDAGRPVRSVGVFVDVTDRKRSELDAEHHRAVMAEQLAQLDAIYATAPVGLCVLDRDCRYLRINERLAEINGMPAARHLGRTLREVVPSLADTLEPVFRRVLETGEAVLEFEVVGETPAQPGEQRCWLESWYPIRDSRQAIVGVGVVAVEVTAQRRAAAEIVRQRQELQTMLDVVPVGIAIAHDARADRITISPPFARLIGTSPQQNLSLSGPESEGVPYRCFRDGTEVSPEELPMQVAARTGREVHGYAYEMHIADGRRLHFVGSAAPLFDDAGRVCGAVGAHADVTELKEVQRRLEAADRQKDEFLAMLAHELRNPLAPLRHAGHVLERTIVADGRASLAVAMIRRQVDQLARLVDDLLDVSRITQGRITLRRAPVSLAAIVEEAIESVEPLLRAHRAEVAVTRPDSVAHVHGDRARLVQCVVNLLTNAVKYSDDSARIRIEVREDGDAGVVEVRDEGVGIAPELLPRVFDLFVQSERTLDRSQGGLGIGLAVVRKLVALHGGTVAARSDGIGRGATFEIRLPLGIPPPCETPDVTPAGTLPRRVLIVDDNADAADALAMCLRLDGHDVATVYSADEALARAPAFAPGVVLLDIGLPDLDGYEVARRLREHGDLAGVRLVALTGYGQPDDRARAQAAGFDEHLVKPVDAAHLERILARVPG